MFFKTEFSTEIEQFIKYDASYPKAHTTVESPVKQSITLSTLPPDINPMVSKKIVCRFV